MKEFLKSIGMNYLFNVGDILFHVPSDSDDSGCNLGLGKMILDNTNLFPSVSYQWA